MNNCCIFLWFLVWFKMTLMNILLCALLVDYRAFLVDYLNFLLSRYKFDDERVTKEDVKRALEEQYGGEEEVALSF